MDEYQQFAYRIVRQLMTARFKREFTDQEVEFFHRKAYEQLFVVTRQVLRDINHYSGRDYQPDIERNLVDLGNLGGDVFYIRLDELPDMLEMLYEWADETCEKGIRLSFHLIQYIEKYISNRSAKDAPDHKLIELHQESVFMLSKKINEDLVNKEKLQVFIEALDPDTIVDRLYEYVEMHLEEERAAG